MKAFLNNMKGGECYVGKNKKGLYVSYIKIYIDYPRKFEFESLDELAEEVIKRSSSNDIDYLGLMMLKDPHLKHIKPISTPEMMELEQKCDKVVKDYQSRNRLKYFWVKKNPYIPYSLPKYTFPEEDEFVIRAKQDLEKESE